eukprot:768759-Hanusia_phi.AAC.22
MSALLSHKENDVKAAEGKIAMLESNIKSLQAEVEHYLGKVHEKTADEKKLQIEVSLRKSFPLDALQTRGQLDKLLDEQNKLERSLAKKEQEVNAQGWQSPRDLSVGERPGDQGRSAQRTSGGPEARGAGTRGLPQQTSVAARYQGSRARLGSVQSPARGEAPAGKMLSTGERSEPMDQARQSATREHFRPATSD